MEVLAAVPLFIIWLQTSLDRGASGSRNSFANQNLSRYELGVWGIEYQQLSKAGFWSYDHAYDIRTLCWVKNLSALNI